jgi:hypothetical protein
MRRQAAELAQIEQRLASLRVVSQTTGTLVMPREQDLPAASWPGQCSRMFSVRSRFA